MFSIYRLISGVCDPPYPEAVLELCCKAVEVPETPPKSPLDQACSGAPHAMTLDEFTSDLLVAGDLEFAAGVVLRQLRTQDYGGAFNTVKVKGVVDGSETNLFVNLPPRRCVGARRPAQNLEARVCHNVLYGR